MNQSPDAMDELREACLARLYTYARTVEPHREYGDCHKELFDWMQFQEADGIENILALLPRDHQKSHIAAVWVSWKLTINPAETVIYLSATTELASRQLDDIKQIFLGLPHRTLWPDMINDNENQRAMWNNEGIKLDHPAREREGVRDPSISIAGMTTNTTGWHCTILVKDDVVIPENAYTEEGRRKVEAKCSQLSSVLTTGGIECVVGTRYHPKDHYHTIKEMQEEVFDENDELIDMANVYSIFERQVEVDGVFLWPRKARPSDGKMFGFDMRQLARKKAKYTDRRQFFAQYYNNPNDREMDKINDDMFQYYDQRHLEWDGMRWWIGDEPMNVLAGMDFAFSKAATADSTTIGVIGITPSNERYILDLKRFKTDKYKNYYEAFEALALKWHFRWGLLEVTAAQVVIANYIRDKLVENNIKVKIDEHRPSRHMGKKEERMDAALYPAYEDRIVYHYRSGLTNMLEEELRLENPPHDDLKDIVAAIFSWDKFKAPRKESKDDMPKVLRPQKKQSRFGGRR
ncbi:terminase large subunit [Vibrio phage 1.139.A._10N.261.48.C6]|nr:terminase large subunit [Vibrio phage 1.034.O._10N.261.46.B7]AUR83440.1 terminase large subunit [Vibrio phage 1.034.X._10N.261.46.B7]AUR90178.1 terminase large subunit [Vibrio phage 1.139.A._10N.261.48.C6]AUR90245.1 terminase large subunit [Vibrio phage 1.139.B._10N.261.48.C6]AUR95567.1 terminase large subunit [Vibrio phage 1.209.O._10N.222.52.B2]